MGFFSKIKDTVKGAFSGFVGSGGNPWGAVVGAGADLLGGYLTNKSNEKLANQANAMSIDLANTSIQRRMADLAQAGLNPLLAVSSASSGAGVPALAVARNERPRMDFASALAVSKYGKEMDLLQAQIDETNSRTRGNELNNSLVEEFGGKEKALDLVMKQSGIKTAELQRELLQAQTRTERERAIVTAIQGSQLMAGTKKILLEQDYIKMLTDNLEYDLGLKKSDPNNTQVMRWLDATTEKLYNIFKTADAGISAFNNFTTKGASKAFDGSGDYYRDPYNKKMYLKDKYWYGGNNAYNYSFN